MTIPNRLLHLLQGVVEGKTATFPATEIFNEGWMLRLLLDALSQHPDLEHPMGVRDGSSWSSEVLLPSPFLARFRGDTLAERETHADAVIGEFDFRPGTRAGLQLRRSCKQFVVVEAKMSSNLSAGVKNASDYDQAARNVACMAHVLAASGHRVEDIEELGFYVIAPEFALRAAFDTNLERLTTPASIRSKVNARIEAYEKAGRPEVDELRAWREGWFNPLVARLETEGCVKVLSWETAIANLASADTGAADELSSFYNRCLEHNMRERRSSPV